MPTQSRAQQTRQALLDAAEREFGKHGYAATTAKTIAARAKTATGSFYQYFTSKDDALLEIARSRQMEIVEHALAALDGALDVAVLPDIRRRMRTIVEVTIAHFTAHRGLQAVLNERRHVDPALDAVLREGERRVIDRVAELLRTWGHGGDVEATAYVLFGAVRGAVHAHVIGQPLLDDARFVAATIDALIRIALPGSFIRAS
jgi:AcrR family transcriptional regulator